MKIQLSRNKLLKINQLKLQERTAGRILAIITDDVGGTDVNINSTETREFLKEYTKDLMKRLGTSSMDLNRGNLYQLIDNLSSTHPVLPQGAICQDKNLRALLRDSGFSNNLISKLRRHTDLNQNVPFTDRSRYGLVTILLEDLRQTSAFSEMAGILVAEYLILELRDKGIDWNSLPVKVVIEDKVNPNSEDLPQIPHGISLETGPQLASSIALDRGLARLYAKAFGKSNIPNRDLLVQNPDKRLIAILNNSRDPLMSILNSETSAAGNPVFELLYAQITEELQTIARRSVPDSHELKLVDSWFDNNPRMASLSTAQLLFNQEVSYLDLKGKLHR